MPNATDYTAKEKAAINTAYSAITYETECTNWSDAPLWRDALKLERPQRNTVTDAKALLVSSFAAGMNHAVSAGDLYGMARGCTFATILGAGMVRRFDLAKLDAMNALFTACAAAYEAQTRRYLDSLRRQDA
jgi:hypothetical protein